jgi:hypothetical protein
VFFNYFLFLKNDVFWDVMSSGCCKTDVSKELSASFIKVIRIGELRPTLAVTSNRLVISFQLTSVASYS